MRKSHVRFLLALACGRGVQLEIMDADIIEKWRFRLAQAGAAFIEAMPLQKREHYVYNFMKYREGERELCYILKDMYGFDVQTEDQKNTEANQTRAGSAQQAVRISRVAILVSLLSFGLAVYSVFVAKGGN